MWFRLRWWTYISIGGTSITLTALAIAAIAGILLNAILPGMIMNSVRIQQVTAAVEFML